MLYQNRRRFPDEGLWSISLALRIAFMYTIRMIKSFRHKGLERFFLTGSKAGITATHAEKLQIRLTALHAATGPDDMNAAALKLHPLTGQNPKKQAVESHWSIWVTGKWRLRFFFEGTDAVLVDYQDYLSPRSRR
ncbi:MAG: Toxin HigB [uncultured Caballeronia sp.]|nr:MAG: Toxin HigB [uncultured Caballeronia sp.]